MKRVIVACEESQIVCKAFRDRGFDAYSCDVKPCSGGHPEWHFQDDIFHVLNREPGFDLLIGFPPCTFLSFAYTGNRRYSVDRLYSKLDALKFFLDLWSFDIKHICLENPMGFAHSGLLPYSQLIEPYYFGHNYKKRTCLWLKNLPLLLHSPERTLFDDKTHSIPTHYLFNSMKISRRKLDSVLGSTSSSTLKSRFHPLVAKAMAEQWGDYLIGLDCV